MDVMNLPDEDLAIYVRTTDPETFRELVVRYEPKILRYTSLLLSNHLVASELTQDVFIEAFENLNQFNPKMKFSTWIYRVAHNRVVSFLFKHRHKGPLGIYVSLEEELLGFDDLEDEKIDKKLFLHVKRSLKALPESQRDPLVLHFFEQKSYDEISDILMLPLQIVTIRVTSAQKMIKRRYENA